MTNQRLFLLILCFVFISFSGFGAKSRICFTFDDLPAVNQQNRQIEKTTSRKLIASLKRNKVPAIGFVNEERLFDKKGVMLDTSRVNLLRIWLKARLEMGNHTYSHMDYNHTVFRKFADDLLRGEKITRSLMAKYHQKMHYFRHPYLSVGETKAKVDSLHAFLVAHKYEEAPVTVENSDWIFALAYDSAMVRKDTVLMQNIGKSYVEYTQLQMKYIEELSHKVFGRNISHILLLHANNINADYLDKIIRVYRENNYKFVSLHKSLKDKAYKTPVTMYGDWGSSWIYRWAMSMGKKENLYAHLPTTPAYILRLANIRE